MEFVVDKTPSYKRFVNNMQEKMADPEFTNDMQSLLRPGITFNACDAYPRFMKHLLIGWREREIVDNIFPNT
jgi:hypothetical protein